MESQKDRKKKRSGAGGRRNQVAGNSRVFFPFDRDHIELARKKAAEATDEGISNRSVKKRMCRSSKANP